MVKLSDSSCIDSQIFDNVRVITRTSVLCPRSRVRAEKKKKKGGGGGGGGGAKGTPTQKAEGRMLNEGSFTDYYVAYGQTEPPSVPVADLFRGEDGEESSNKTHLPRFPEGEIQEHPLESNVHRMSSAELRQAERLQSGLYDKLRHGVRSARTPGLL